MTPTETRARQRLASLTAGLERLGNPAVEYSESPYFGDYVITAKWPEIQVRVVRDRDLERAELRPAHSEEEWLDVPIVLTLVGGSERNEELALERQMHLLTANLSAILREFRQDAWPATKAKLESLQRERARRRFGPRPEA